MGGHAPPRPPHPAERQTPRRRRGGGAGGGRGPPGGVLHRGGGGGARAGGGGEGGERPRSRSVGANGRQAPTCRALHGDPETAKALEGAWEVRSKGPSGCRHCAATATSAQRLRAETRGRRRLSRRDGRSARPACTGGAFSSSIPKTADKRSSAMRLPTAGCARDTAPAVAELSSSAWSTWRSTKYSSGLASRRMPTP